MPINLWIPRSANVRAGNPVLIAVSACYPRGSGLTGKAPSMGGRGRASHSDVAVDARLSTGDRPVKR